MKPFITFLLILAATLTAPAAEIPQSAIRAPQSKVPGWKRLWLPVVEWRDCVSTPDKVRANKLMAPSPLHHDAASPITGRF